MKVIERRHSEYLWYAFDVAGSFEGDRVHGGTALRRSPFEALLHSSATSTDVTFLRVNTHPSVGSTTHPWCDLIKPVDRLLHEFSLDLVKNLKSVASASGMPGLAEFAHMAIVVKQEWISRGLDKPAYAEGLIKEEIGEIDGLDSREDLTKVVRSLFGPSPVHAVGDLYRYLGYELPPLTQHRSEQCDLVYDQFSSRLNDLINNEIITRDAESKLLFREGHRKWAR